MKKRLKSRVCRAALAGFFLVVLLLCFSQRWVHAQAPRITAQAVIDSTQQQFNRVQDYMVIVHVSVRMPGFRMPQKRVDLAFKQPDKVKVKTEGFAVVPRAGLVAAPDDIFRQLSDIRVVGDTLLDNTVHYILRAEISPNDSLFSNGPHRRREPRPSSIRLWVRSHPWLLTRLDAFTDSTRVASIHLTYARIKDHIWLPDTTVFSFRIPQEQIRNSGNSFESEGGPGFGENFESAIPDSGVIKGSVTLIFSHYRVNTGLQNRFFENQQ